MPATSQWLEEPRIILTQLSGQLSGEEAQQLSAAQEEFLNTGQAPVHIVVDLTDMESIPTNLRDYLTMGSYLRNPALGWVVLVGGNVLVNFILQVLSQAFHLQCAKRETVAAAVTFLAEQDNTLHFEAHA